MSDEQQHEQQHEHPGPEWVKDVHPNGTPCWFHPGLNLWRPLKAAADCRAISAAALAWERRKAEAVRAAAPEWGECQTPGCGATRPMEHHFSCPNRIR